MNEGIMREFLGEVVDAVYEVAYAVKLDGAEARSAFENNPKMRALEEKARAAGIDWVKLLSIVKTLVYLLLGINTDTTPATE